MRDVLGWRKKFGVLIPSTNTVVEPEFHAMSVPGVTAHTGRIHIRNQCIASDGALLRLLEQVRVEIDQATACLITAQPDALVMGMSVETFWGGQAGLRAFKSQIKERTGLEIVTGAEACSAALSVLGAKRIGVITPYQPLGNEKVRGFFEEIGLEVTAIASLPCATAVSIAEVGEDAVMRLLEEVDSPAVDALVQSGTNLGVARLVDTAERRFGKPVVAVNVATWWMALRGHGIDDKVHGYGTLLREY